MTSLPVELKHPPVEQIRVFGLPLSEYSREDLEIIIAHLTTDHQEFDKRVDDEVRRLIELARKKILDPKWWDKARNND